MIIALLAVSAVGAVLMLFCICMAIVSSKRIPQVRPKLPRPLSAHPLDQEMWAMLRQVEREVKNAR